MGSTWEWDFLSKQEERHPIQLFIWSCLKEHLHLSHLWPIFQSTQQLSDKDAHWIFRIEYIVSGPNQLQKTLQSEQISAFQTSFLFQYLISLFSFICSSPAFWKKNAIHWKIFNFFMQIHKHLQISVHSQVCGSHYRIADEERTLPLHSETVLVISKFDFQRSNMIFVLFVLTKSSGQHV